MNKVLLVCIFILSLFIIGLAWGAYERQAYMMGIVFGLLGFTALIVVGISLFIKEDK